MTVETQPNHLEIEDGTLVLKLTTGPRAGEEIAYDLDMILLAISDTRTACPYYDITPGEMEETNRQQQLAGLEPKYDQDALSGKTRWHRPTLQFYTLLADNIASCGYYCTPSMAKWFVENLGRCVEELKKNTVTTQSSNPSTDPTPTPEETGNESKG